MCRDGDFVPIASFNGRTWRNLTKASDRTAYYFGELTAAGRRLPRRGWTLRPLDGSAPRPFSLKAPPRITDLHPAKCAYVQRFKTDVAPVSGRPDDELGLASFGAVGIEPLEDVTAQPDAASRRMARWFVRRVLTVEPRLLNEPNPYVIKPTSEQQRRALVRVETLVRQPAADGGALYYGEAVKKYPDTGTLVTVSAWLKESRDSVRVTKVAESLGNEDSNREWRRGRAAARISDREYWLMHVNGDWSIFDVTSWPPARDAVATMTFVEY